MNATSCRQQGKSNFILPPGGLGVRVDSAAYPGYTIPPHYDSMIAKLIVWGATREEAIARMKRALGEFAVEGVHTTIPFHLEAAGSSEVSSRAISTLSSWKSTMYSRDTEFYANSRVCHNFGGMV